MSTNHGVIQGYNGVAVVDEKHQIVVKAQAHGEGQETHLLKPMLDSTREELKAAKISKDIFQQAKLTADARYHSNASVSYTQEHGIDAYIADRNHRQRDPAFADYDRYKTRSRWGRSGAITERMQLDLRPKTLSTTKPISPIDVGVAVELVSRWTESGLAARPSETRA